MIPRAVAVGVVVLAMLAWTASKSRGQSKGLVSRHGRIVAAAFDDSRGDTGLTAVLVTEAPVLVRAPAVVLVKPARRLPGRNRGAPSSLDQPPIPPGFGKPVIVATKDLRDFEQLPVGRRKLVATAIALARNSPWLPYTYGGADPALGGLDCSGAMYYVMTQIGLDPPRTSAGQYLWLREHQRIHLIANDATTIDHPSLAWLQPGDLLFWSTSLAASSAAVVNITHVAMYLGREKSDGWRVMINSTDGRSYRGTQANGYGVYDFSMPRAGAAAKLVGYGLPPGIAESEPPALR